MASIRMGRVTDNLSDGTILYNVARFALTGGGFSQKLQSKANHTAFVGQFRLKCFGLRNFVNVVVHWTGIFWHLTGFPSRLTDCEHGSPWEAGLAIPSHVELNGRLS